MYRFRRAQTWLQREPKTRYPTPNTLPFVSRRTVLQALAAAFAGTMGKELLAMESTAEPAAAPFRTRGIVLVPEDLTLADWPERAARAGLTTLGLHHPDSPAAVARFIASDGGQKMLAACRRLGLQVEYELHAMRELLPRDLHARAPELFRMDEKGDRVADANLCVHAPRALEIVEENAVRLAQQLRPTTGRHFFWGDDGLPWCRCPSCRAFSDSEQAVILENHIVAALRKTDPRATLAHLAYLNTLAPPRQVKPAPGLFLEYAPIKRRYDIPYAQQTGPDMADGLPALDANLTVFPRETAQVLEYWLDASRFSEWKRPARKVPWDRAVCRADLQTYASRGIRHATTFAVWIDAAYVAAHGEPAFVDEYGEAFK